MGTLHEYKYKFYGTTSVHTRPCPRYVGHSNRSHNTRHTIYNRIVPPENKSGNDRNYSEWCDAYSHELEDLFSIFTTNVKNLYPSLHLNSEDYKTFCYLIYSKSSKFIPDYYYEV